MKTKFTLIQSTFLAAFTFLFYGQFNGQIITNITPDHVKSGQTLDVVISGNNTHFGQGTSVLNSSVWFSQATGTASPVVIFPNSVTINSLTQMVANVSFLSSYPLGDYHVNTVNGTDGQITRAFGMNINNWPVGIADFKKNYSLDVYPNPVVDAVTINLDLAVKNDLVYRLVDINGREIFVQKVANASTGRQTQRFDLKANGLKAGTYFLQITVGRETATQAIILQ